MQVIILWGLHTLLLKNKTSGNGWETMVMDEKLVETSENVKIVDRNWFFFSLLMDVTVLARKSNR